MPRNEPKPSNFCVFRGKLKLEIGKFEIPDLMISQESLTKMDLDNLTHS